tara:strand:+ start:4140 stop:4373 length:234 start_codon:yes stop_codon:yes gene_type:complete
MVAEDSEGLKETCVATELAKLRMDSESVVSRQPSDDRRGFFEPQILNVYQQRHVRDDPCFYTYTFLAFNLMRHDFLG